MREEGAALCVRGCNLVYQVEQREERVQQEADATSQQQAAHIHTHDNTYT